MIDFSQFSLTALQGWIACLIERRKEGRRVNELCKETQKTKKAVIDSLNHLVSIGLIQRIEGDIPRYYPLPPVTVGLPPVTAGLPPVTVGLPPVTAGLPLVTVGLPPVTVGLPPVTVGLPPVTAELPPAGTAPLTVNVNSNFNKLNSTGKKDDLGTVPHSCPVCGSSRNHSVPDTPHRQNAITRPQTATDASGVKSTAHERDCARSSHEQDCVSPAFTASDEDTNGRVAAPANEQIVQNGNTEQQSGKPGGCEARSADNVTAGLTQSRSLTETAERPETPFPALEYEKTGRYANRPKFTKIVEMPQNGDFDGLIYAADLNRYTYMSRMIAALGVGESANGLVGELPFQEERFLLFKQTLTWDVLKFICEYRVRETGKWELNYQLIAKFRDEVLHRLAFARAMNVTELANFDQWVFDQRQKATKKTPDSINRKGGRDVHTVLIQELQQIFWRHKFGWAYNHLIPSESFRYIDYEGLPAAELCPVHCWLQRNKDANFQKMMQEREMQRQAAAETQRLEPLQNRYKIAEPFHKVFKAYLPSVKETTQWHEYLKRFDNVTETELAAALQAEAERLREEYYVRQQQQMHDLLEESQKKKAKVQDCCPALTRSFGKLGKALKGG